MDWKQINHSHTKEKGTIRGLHYQVPPFSEVKLIRCINGKILDVAVDIRHDSPTYLNYIDVELSAENRKMIYIPEGLAHGFQSLTDNVDMLYHHSAFYDPTAERGIRYDEKHVNISWPLAVTTVSDRDLALPIIDANFKGL